MQFHILQCLWSVVFSQPVFVLFRGLCLLVYLSKYVSSHLWIFLYTSTVAGARPSSYDSTVYVRPMYFRFCVWRHTVGSMARGAVLQQVVDISSVFASGRHAVLTVVVRSSGTFRSWAKCAVYDWFVAYSADCWTSWCRVGITKSEVGGQSRHNLWLGIIR